MIRATLLSGLLWAVGCCGSQLKHPDLRSMEARLAALERRVEVIEVVPVAIEVQITSAEVGQILYTFRKWGRQATGHFQYSIPKLNRTEWVVAGSLSEESIASLLSTRKPQTIVSSADVNGDQTPEIVPFDGEHVDFVLRRKDTGKVILFSVF